MSARWQGISPGKRVDHWLSIAGRDAEPSRLDAPVRAANGYSHLHPFVGEAAALAVRALETGIRSAICGSIETGVVNRVGSRPTDPTQPRIHNLWIPPSTGWTALDRRAQKRGSPTCSSLLNLSERGGAEDHERYLERRQPGRSPALPHRRPEPNAAGPQHRPTGDEHTRVQLCRRMPLRALPYPPRGTPPTPRARGGLLPEAESHWRDGGNPGAGSAAARHPGGVPAGPAGNAPEAETSERSGARSPNRRRVPAPDTTGP